MSKAFNLHQEYSGNVVRFVEDHLERHKVSGTENEKWFDDRYLCRRVGVRVYNDRPADKLLQATEFCKHFPDVVKERPVTVDYSGGAGSKEFIDRAVSAGLTKMHKGLSMNEKDKIRERDKLQEEALEAAGEYGDAALYLQDKQNMYWCSLTNRLQPMPDNYLRYKQVYSEENIAEKEEWRYCPGLRDVLQISNFGRMRSRKRNSNLYTMKCQIPIGDMSACPKGWRRYCEDEGIIPFVGWKDCVFEDYDWNILKWKILGTRKYPAQDVEWSATLQAKSLGVNNRVMFTGDNYEVWRGDKAAPATLQMASNKLSLLTFAVPGNPSWKTESEYKAASDKAKASGLQADLDAVDLKEKPTLYVPVHLSLDRWNCRADELVWVKEIYRRQYTADVGEWRGVDRGMSSAVSEALYSELRYRFFHLSSRRKKGSQFRNIDIAKKHGLTAKQVSRIDIELRPEFQRELDTRNSEVKRRQAAEDLKDKLQEQQKLIADGFYLFLFCSPDKQGYYDKSKLVKKKKVEGFRVGGCRYHVGEVWVHEGTFLQDITDYKSKIKGYTSPGHKPIRNTYQDVCNWLRDIGIDCSADVLKRMFNKKEDISATDGVILQGSAAPKVNVRVPTEELDKRKGIFIDDDDDEMEGVIMM